MTNKIARRRFLAMSGIATLSSTPAVHSIQKVFIGGLLVIDTPPDVIFSYIRAKDLLYMQISCYNCGGNDLSVMNAGANAYIKVSLPHAHISEETFTPEEFGQAPQTPAKAFLSDPTILVFKVKRGPVNLKNALLNWDKLTTLQLVGLDKPSVNYAIPGSARFPKANTIMEIDGQAPKAPTLKPPSRHL